MEKNEEKAGAVETSMNATPTPDDLRARLRILADDYPVGSIHHNTVEQAIAALSALPAAGEPVAEVLAGAFGTHYIACVDPNKLPVGTKLYTTPQPSAVSFDPASIGPFTAAAALMQATDAAVGAQGDGAPVCVSGEHFQAALTAYEQAHEATDSHCEGIAAALTAYRDFLAQSSPDAAPAAGKGVDDGDRAYWMSELWNAILRLGGKHKEELLKAFHRAEQAALARQPVAGGGWRPIESAPKGVDCIFWIEPKTADETYHDTDGNPILANITPYARQCKYGEWGSLTKATWWQPVQVIVPPAPAATPTCAHEWVSGDNKYVSNTLICQRCYAIKPAATPTDGGEGCGWPAAELEAAFTRQPFTPNEKLARAMERASQDGENENGSL